MFAKMRAAGLNPVPTYAEYDDFHTAWDATFPLEFWGFNSVRMAARLVPTTNWSNDTIVDSTFEAARSIVEDGAEFYGFHISGGNADYPDNAVLPAWREASAHVNVCTFWNASLWATAEGRADIKANYSDKLTYDYMERLRAVTPGSGAYMSEGDYIEPNFQTSFFGVNYDKLLSIKDKYDPDDVFYAYNGVGSHRWEHEEFLLENLPSQASRLCKVQTG